MQPSTYYHIYNHANGSENLFRSEENYRYFLQQWGKYIEPIAHIYAYCLMPNHFHILIKTKSEKEFLDLTGFKNLSGLKETEKFISQHFSNLFNSYTKAYNKMYERRGSLWNRPFKAKEITSDSYLTNVIFYIHHNPVHHGFTEKIEDWPHSSYHSLLSKKDTKLKRQETIAWFGNKKELNRFHQQALKNLNALEMDFT
jgi:REP-associated tyrosine transposase